MTDGKSSPPVDFETLNDYLDGRLSVEQCVELEAIVAADPAVAEELAALKALNEQIHMLGAERLDESVPDRLLDIIRAGTKKK